MPNETLQRIGAGIFVRLGLLGGSKVLFWCNAVWRRTRPDR